MIVVPNRYSGPFGTLGKMPVIFFFVISDLHLYLAKWGAI
jgi:hypothetical protein